MTYASVSSSYLSSAMLPTVRQTQAQLANLEIESSTGQYSDLGLQLGSQNGYELSLRSQDDLLSALTTANSMTSTNLDTAQTALSSLLSSAQSAAQQLTQVTSTATSSATLQTLGQSNLQQLIGIGNTNVAGTYIFAGQNISTAPINDYFAASGSSAKSSFQSAFQSYFGFATTAPDVANITATQMQGFLSGPLAQEFQTPNWGQNWSNASSTNTSSQIGPGNVIDTSTNTNTAGFSQLAQGYTMLSELGSIGLPTGVVQVVASAALTAVSQGVSAVTVAQAQLGASQAQIASANTAMSDQMNMLQNQISKSDSVDGAQIATELTTLTTQLETAYRITSQIHSMNLAQYLPT